MGLASAHSLDVSATAAWLVDGARSASSSGDVLAELCARLVDDGLPLWRVAVFVSTLHPEIMGAGSSGGGGQRSKSPKRHSSLSTKAAI